MTERRSPEFPATALVIVPGEDIVGRIQRGELGYTPIYGMTAAEADAENARNGVTPALRESMMLGSMFGWGRPGADPMTAEQKFHRAKPLAERHG